MTFHEESQDYEYIIVWHDCNFAISEEQFILKTSQYSRLCLNPYLSVDTKKYGLLQSMGFGRAHLRAIFLCHIMLYNYVLNDYTE